MSKQYKLSRYIKIILIERKNNEKDFYSDFNGFFYCAKLSNL